MISHSLPGLEFTTCVMLVEIGCNGARKGRDSAAGEIVGNVIAKDQRSKPVIYSFRWVR